MRESSELTSTEAFNVLLALDSAKSDYFQEAKFKLVQKLYINYLKKTPSRAMSKNISVRIAYRFVIKVMI